jgi:O-antigen/teichoic acid export membrane protein
VRKEGDCDEGEYSLALLIVLAIGFVTIPLAVISVRYLEPWTGIPHFAAMTSALLLALPAALCSSITFARLERAIDYRSVAAADLAGQCSYYALALPVAYLGGGVWAPVAGWWAKELLTLVVSFRASRFSPSWYWNWSTAKMMLRYGFGYSSSLLVWQGRSLVNPLVVARYAGAETVGYIALTIRIVEYLSFAKTSAFRLSIVAFGRIQADSRKLAAAVTDGMGFQLILVGPFLIGFGWVAPWIVPLVLGDRWLRVLDVYPFIALAYVTNALFNLHSSLLYVLKRNWDVTVFNAAHVAILALAVRLFVPTYGVVGYGFAEVLTLTSYLVIHYDVLRQLGSVKYFPALAWWAAFVPCLFWRYLGPWSLLGLVAVAVWPGTYAHLGRYFDDLSAALRRN